MLRLWSFWSNQQVQPGCSTVFSVSRVLVPCFFFPGFSFPTQGCAAAMSYSSRLCPYPVGPSLLPCSLLVVRSGGNFRLVVSRGGLPYLHCQCAFGDGRGSPPLSFFTVYFHVLGVRSCGFSPDLGSSFCPPYPPLA